MPSRAEVVAITTVSPETGESCGPTMYGVAASGRFGSTIIRGAASLSELAEMVGDLSDSEALWAWVQAQDPSIGTWAGEPIDPLDAL